MPTLKAPPPGLEAGIWNPGRPPGTAERLLDIVFSALIAVPHAWRPLENSNNRLYPSSPEGAT